MPATYVGTDCLSNRISHAREFVDEAVANLTPLAGEFDTIVVSGITGMLVGPWLASRLGKHLAIVRKAGDHHSHALYDGPDSPGVPVGSDVEGHVGDRYIVVDDHVAAGRTMARVQRKIAEAKPSARYAGRYLYDQPLEGATWDIAGQHGGGGQIAWILRNLTAA
jgi:adenine/guanine phosphoribosyltransferase-like PRPP-binding protein